MKPIYWVLIALAFLVVVVGLCGVTSNNGMVGADNAVEKAWGDVQSAYQQRLDTLPKFADTARLSTEFQLALQERYVEARNAVNKAVVGEDGESIVDPAALESAANAEFAGLRSMLTIQVEATPDAKTDQLTELNAQIESVERVIKHERDAYNGAVENYNNKVEKIPGSVFASAFGFEKDRYKSFSASEEAQNSPDLDLGLK